VKWFPFKTPMEREVYLDNSATTPVFPEVLEYIYNIQLYNYGNPSSLHLKGIEAEKEMEAARKSIAAILRCSPREIVFTSGGTESNNLAIKGLSSRNQRRGKHLITTPIEHPSALNSFKQLEHDGFAVSYVPVAYDGAIDLDRLLALVNSHTILVSFIHVNNEIGTTQDLSSIVNALKEKFPQVLVHLDCVQSLGKIKLHPGELGLDALSMSSHKIHGPKGAGALWIREGANILPLFNGGDQEQEIRPGTENVPGIVGFGKAVQYYIDHYEGEIPGLQELKIEFMEKLTPFLEVKINGPALEEGAPHILNLSFPGIQSEVLIRSLEEQGVYCSPGSACHSRKPQPSHVLNALGLPKERIDSAIRFSFSVLNTREEIDYAAKKVVSCVNELSALMN